MSQGDAKITAAIGFCELAMWQAAWDELETLEPEERALPIVLRVKLGIFIALERWESAVLLAEGMIARSDDSPITWLYGAPVDPSPRQFVRWMLPRSFESSDQQPRRAASSPPLP
jgi:hypothetical protein